MKEKVKLYYPNGEFWYDTFEGERDCAPLGSVILSEEEIKGLDNRTLHWVNGELKPYIPTDEEREEEEERERLRLKERRMAELKKWLKDTDYLAIKYAEGEISEEDYYPTREMRKNWRKEINLLQS